MDIETLATCLGKIESVNDALSSLDSSVSSIEDNIAGLYCKRIENIQSKDKLQIRQSRTGNTAQSFLIIGSTIGTNTVLALIAITTGTQTLKVTSLGQQTVTADLSASPDYYPQAVVGQYFSGLVLSLYPFTVVPY